ncbi:MAG: hypothetical protein LUD55_06155 [Oscillospiraceae bacterium]|nr:hypothetical protein [Oscillospiraceae bacterium]
MTEVEFENEKKSAATMSAAADFFVGSVSIVGQSKIKPAPYNRKKTSTLFAKSGK